MDSLTDTSAGIAPSGVPAFVVAQLLGAIAAAWPMPLAHAHRLFVKIVCILLRVASSWVLKGPERGDKRHEPKK
jgi:hypothetical protein